MDNVGRARRISTLPGLTTTDCAESVMAKDHLTIDLFGDKPERPAKPKRTAKKPRRIPMVSKDGKVTLYFLQQGECGPIKIGRTRDQESLITRIYNLMGGSAFDLNLIGSCRCEPWVETGLHQLFHRDRMNREWFVATPTILAIARASNDGYEAMLKEAADVLSINHAYRGSRPRHPPSAWRMLQERINSV